MDAPSVLGCTLQTCPQHSLSTSYFLEELEVLGSLSLWFLLYCPPLESVISLKILSPFAEKWGFEIKLDVSVASGVLLLLHLPRQQARKFYLSIYLSIYLSFICLSVYLSIHFCRCICICMHLYLYPHLSLDLYLCILKAMSAIKPSSTAQKIEDISVFETPISNHLKHGYYYQQSVFICLITFST
jgi:hypothetical protein